VAVYILASKRLKQDLMAEILGFLAYSALKNSDNLTTLFFSKGLEKLYKLLPIRVFCLLW